MNSRTSRRRPFGSLLPTFAPERIADRERLWNENVAIHIDELPGSELMAMHVGTLFVSQDYLTQGSLPTAIMEITEWDCVTFDGMLGGSSWVFKQAL
jgi:hypothetical protein